MESEFYLRFRDLCKAAGRSPNSVARELGIPSGSVTAWKQGATPRSKAAGKIAAHFGVTESWLKGDDRPAAPAVNREELKFALFGGDGEISDTMFDEVVQFAQFVKQREAARKKE